MLPPQTAQDLERQIVSTKMGTWCFDAASGTEDWSTGLFALTEISSRETHPPLREVFPLLDRKINQAVSSKIADDDFLFSFRSKRIRCSLNLFYTREGALERIQASFLEAETATTENASDDVASILVTAIQSSPDIVLFATDRNGILTYTNGKGLAAIGAEPGVGVGETIENFFKCDDDAKREIQEVLSGKTITTIALNTGRYFERRLVPSIGQDGTVSGLAGFSIDITERYKAEETLLSQKELLNNLFDSIPDNAYVLDRDFNVLMANEAARDMFADRELVGPPCFKTVHGIESPCKFCPVIDTFRSGMPTRREYFDETFQSYYELTSFPIRDAEGNIIGATEIARNVTETKRIQETLRKSEELLNDLFSSISDGIFVIDKEYTMSRTNRSMDEMYAEHLPLAGKKCYVTSLLDEVCPNCPAEKMFATGKPVTTEHYETPTDEKPGIWLDHTAYPVVDKTSGEITGAISVIRDVTARKNAEIELQQYREELEKRVDERTAQLHASEQKLLSILETSTAPISFADGNGTFTYINNAYKEMLGYDGADLIGRSIFTVLPESERKTSRRIEDIVSAPEGKFRFTLPLQTKGGKLLWGDINVSVIHGNNADETLLISVIVDVTARQQILDELNQAKNAAEEASQAKSQFLATMSHEIRTPLNGVIGLSDLMLATPLQPKQFEYAKLIKASGNSLLFLINDILDFSKIEAGKFDLEHIEFDLSDMVESVMGILASKAHDQNLELAVTFGPKVPRPVSGDPNRLRQVLINLIGNGLKFTKEGGVRIHISSENIRPTELTIRFEVIDTGIGIAEDRLNRLFQPFSQVDASSARLYGGTGLGLAITKKLVELMGGTVGVSSTLGEGSTFWFSVPLQCSESITECLRSQMPLCVEQKVSICPRSDKEVCPGSGRRAGLSMRALSGIPTLVASGNKIQRQALEVQFKIWGLAVVTTDRFDVAVTKINEAADAGNPYRLIVVDADLDADHPGEELIQSIQGDDRLKSTALIYLVPLSANTEDAELFPVDVQTITKPVYCSALFKAVAKSLIEDHATLLHVPMAETGCAHTVPTLKGPPRTLKVLVAEDNRVNQIVISEVLKNAGIECTLVANGIEAVEAVRRSFFDAVLMDCQMPIMDGYAATGAIRKWETEQSVKRLPIIALTANATKGDEEKCLQSGMDAYCSKPIDPKLVVRLLEKWTSPNS